jgi:hypothetical protein
MGGQVYKDSNDFSLFSGEQGSTTQLHARILPLQAGKKIHPGSLPPIPPEDYSTSTTKWNTPVSILRR